MTPGKYGVSSQPVTGRWESYQPPSVSTLKKYFKIKLDFLVEMMYIYYTTLTKGLKMKKLYCESCGKELVDDVTCEDMNSGYYTFLGNGPFCYKHYKELQNKDDELFAE
jgi:hypothetical protein